MSTTRGMVVGAWDRVAAAARREDGQGMLALIDDAIQRLGALDPADAEERAVVDMFLAALPRQRASLEEKLQPGYEGSPEAEAADQRVIDELTKAYGRALRLPVQRRGFTRAGVVK